MPDTAVRRHRTGQTGQNLQDLSPAQQLGDVLWPGGAREVPALYGVATDAVQPLHLRGRLDVDSGNAQTPSVCELDERSHDLRVDRVDLVGGQAQQHSAGDLHLVHGQVFQHGEVRGAATE